MASASKGGILRNADDARTASPTPAREMEEPGQVNYAPGTHEPVPTAPTVGAAAAAAGGHRHHHHDHQPYQEPHPDFSLAGNHPLNAAQYGAYPGSFPGYPYAISQQSVAARQRKAEPLYGLGKPLPTTEEVKALKQMKAGQHRGEHGTVTSPTSLTLQRTRSRGHTPRTSDVEGLGENWNDSELRHGAPQYVMATPDLLRTLIAEASLLHPMSQKSNLLSLSRVNSMNQNNGTLDEKNGQIVQTDSGKSGGQDSATLTESESDGEDDFPNPWARFRHTIREPAAEFLGTCLLIIFGTGVNNQVFLSTAGSVSSVQRGQFLSISFGWGIGVLAGVYTAGGISGGHINPAVTLSLAVFRGFPWKKVLPYIGGQVLGAFTGAVLTQAIYAEALNLYEGGVGVRTTGLPTSTAGLFYTGPLDYMSNVNSFFSEFMDTAILLIIVLAIGDRNNSPPPDGMNPFVLLWVIVGIGACLGMQTGYAINPARDFGPRLMAACFGYGSDVWDFRSQYWLWTPWIATCTGGLFGCFVYDTLIYTGSESPINKPWRGRLGFGRSSKPELPAGRDGQIA